MLREAKQAFGRNRVFPAQDFFTYEVLNRAQLAAEDKSSDPGLLAGLYSADITWKLYLLHAEGANRNLQCMTIGILQAPCSLLRRKTLGLPESNDLSRNRARPAGERCPEEEGELAAGVGVVAEATLRATTGVDPVALMEAASTAMEADSVN